MLEFYLLNCFVPVIRHGTNDSKIVPIFVSGHKIFIIFRIIELVKFSIMSNLYFFSHSRGYLTVDLVKTSEKVPTLYLQNKKTVVMNKYHRNDMSNRFEHFFRETTHTSSPSKILQ